MTDNLDKECIENCRKLTTEIGKINDFETIVFEYYATKEDQKTMLALGFVGDFIVRDLPCQNVEKPYITYDEFLENGFQGQEQVQCPLYGQKCDIIGTSTSSNSVGCELLLKKLEKILG